VNPVSAFLRSEAVRITALWETEARAQLPALAGLTRPMLIDHLPELIDGLAAYIDGDAERADRAFDTLTVGHALQRLGYGVALETLIKEYTLLRAVLLRELLQLQNDDLRPLLLPLHEGLDRAIGRALQFYAQRRDAIRERFISILGHDLRGPLSTVAMSAELLRAGAPDRNAIADRITRASDRMRRMIDDVLDFARGHLGGGIPANPKLDDLGEICRLAVDEVRGAERTRDITLAVAGDLRAPLDRDRVLQAVTNLVSNAIEHGTGPIDVRATEDPDRHHVVCTVTSHGAVIPEDTRRRLFDPFERGVVRTKKGGLGLGLYIVFQIALAHGATCDVASTSDATTFTLRFPRVPGAPRRAIAADRR